MPSRRTFVATAAAALARLAAGCQSPPPERRPTGILDTHTHFYDPTRPDGVPWPPANDPVLFRPVLPPEYVALARPLGIVGTVVVEASTLDADNRWILDLADHAPFLRALIGHLKPGRPGFAQQLARDAVDRRFRGIRLGTWDGPLRVDEPAFLADCRSLAERQLTADVLVGPDQLDAVARLAALVPELSIVINHCANVRIDGRTPPTQWLQGIAAVARQPRVFMKMSGYVEGTGRTDGTAPRDTEFYRPTFDALLAQFGPERLIFGSNWPVSARFASLATVVGIVRDYFSVQPARVAAAYFADNARRAYRLVD